MLSPFQIAEQSVAGWWEMVASRRDRVQRDFATWILMLSIVGVAGTLAAFTMTLSRRLIASHRGIL
jgi:hypothetical protein